MYRADQFHVRSLVDVDDNGMRKGLLQFHKIHRRSKRHVNLKQEKSADHFDELVEQSDNHVLQRFFDQLWRNHLSLQLQLMLFW